MNKYLFFIFVSFSITFSSLGQAMNNKMLFIIDSIPLFTDPEEWNQISQDDIADYSVITQRDSLKLLGWEQVDGITYIFTKEYRKRPDSIKSIPSLKQMVMKEGNWYLRGSLYTGRYIDYYYNGRIQNEGTLLNGKIDGELTVYYKSGIKKSVTNFKEGIKHGGWREYYQNGSLMRGDEYVNGKSNRTEKKYFINGQIAHELKLSKATGYDTSISYYSTGKIKQTSFTRTGEFYPDKKTTNLNYHTTMFWQHIRTGDVKAANKNFYQIWLIDSMSIDTYFKEGLLLATEFRFDEAIAQFDKALTIEPLMREALEQRGLARLKRYKLSTVPLKDKKQIPLALEDIMQLPEDEKEKVCGDLILADDLDPGVNYNNKAVPGVILNYCKKRNGR